MGWFGDATNAVLGIMGAVEGANNYRLQQQQFDYQKQLQQQIFNREDTSYQRAANDLAQAGLSKTLSAGSGSSAGSVVSTSAPQSDIMGRMGAAMQLSQINAQTKKIEAETANTLAGSELIKAQIPSEIYKQNLMKAQEALVTGQTAFLGVQTDQARAMIRKIETEIDEKLKNMGYTDAQIAHVNAQTKKLGYDTDLVIEAINKSKSEQAKIDAETGKITAETKQIDKELELFDTKKQMMEQQLAGALLDNQMKSLEGMFAQEYGARMPIYDTGKQSAKLKLPLGFEFEFDWKKWNHKFKF